MCGSPARGSRVERQRLFGWKVIGSVVPVAGCGSQATGSKIRCTLRICFCPSEREAVKMLQAENCAKLFGHFESGIVNANHRIAGSGVKLCVVDCVADRV